MSRFVPAGTGAGPAPTVRPRLSIGVTGTPGAPPSSRILGREAEQPGGVGGAMGIPSGPRLTPLPLIRVPQIGPLRELGYDVKDVAGNFALGAADMFLSTADAALRFRRKVDDIVSSARRSVVGRTAADDFEANFNINAAGNEAIAEIRSWLRENLTDPSQEDNAYARFANALGSAAGFALGGWAAKSALAVPAFMGFGVGAEELYQDAVNHGASESDAFKAWLLGGGIGLSEIVPMERWVNRLVGGQALKRGLRQALREFGVETVGEAAQEWFQTTAGNAVARELYDRNRDLFTGSGEAALMGGGVGAIMSAITQAATGGFRSRGRRVDALTDEVSRVRAEEQSPLYASDPEYRRMIDSRAADAQRNLVAAVGEDQAAQILQDLYRGMGTTRPRRFLTPDVPDETPRDQAPAYRPSAAGDFQSAIEMARPDLPLIPTPPTASQTRAQIDQAALAAAGTMRPDRVAVSPTSHELRGTVSYTPQAGLSERARAAEKEFGDWINEDPERAISDYEAIAAKDDRFIYSTDDARKLAPSWTDDPMDRAEANVAIQSPSAALARAAFFRRIQQQAAPGQDDIVVMAGGPGAGKTTILDEFRKPQRDYHAALDTTLASPESARALIRRIGSSGKPIRIVFTITEPVSAFERSLARGNRESSDSYGRFVGTNYHGTTHGAALETFLQMAEEFKNVPNLKFLVYDNSGPSGSHHVSSILKVGEALKELRNRYPTTENLITRLEEVANDYIAAERAAGREMVAARTEVGLGRRDRGIREALRQNDGEDPRRNRNRESQVPDGKPRLRSQVRAGLRSRQVTPELIRRAFGDAAKVTPSADSGGGYVVTFNDGTQIRIRTDAQIEINPERVKKSRGRPLYPDEKATGTWQAMPFGGIIQLARIANYGTLTHEVFHAAMELALTSGERRALIRKFMPQGAADTETARLQAEEAAAKAYAEWDGAGQGQHWTFGKILQFFKDLITTMTGGDPVLGIEIERIFERIRNGQVWTRRMNSRGDELTRRRLGRADGGEVYYSLDSDGTPRLTKWGDPAFSDAFPIGLTAESYKEPGVPAVAYRYRVVELGSLIRSHVDGKPNPNYPQERQPRDRGSYLDTIRREVQSTQGDPRRLLVESMDIKTGIPVTTGMVVAGGNGRVDGLEHLRRSRPDLWQEYQDGLAAIAPRYGIDPADFAEMKAPVLVKEVVSDIDPRRLAHWTNRGAGGAMSATEQASYDVEVLTPELMTLLVVDDKKTLRAAIRSVENNYFRVAFMQALPIETVGNAIKKDGSDLSIDGLKRLERAILMRIFRGTAGLQVGTLMEEEPGSTSIGRVLQGIRRTIPALTRIENMILMGAKDEGLRIGEDLAVALLKMRHLARTGVSVDDYIRQIELFKSPDMTTESLMLLEALSSFKTAKEVANFLNRYAEAVFNAPTLNGTASLFETDSAVSKADLIRKAAAEELTLASRKMEETAESQAAMGPTRSKDAETIEAPLAYSSDDGRMPLFAQDVAAAVADLNRIAAENGTITQEDVERILEAQRHLWQDGLFEDAVVRAVQEMNARRQTGAAPVAPSMERRIGPLFSPEVVRAVEEWNRTHRPNQQAPAAAPAAPTPTRADWRLIPSMIRAGYQKTTGANPLGWMRKAVRRIVDNARPLKRVDDLLAKRTGRPRLGTESLWQVYDRNRAGVTQMKFIEHGAIDGQGRVVGKPLAEILAPHAREAYKLDALLTAYRALDYARRGVQFLPAADRTVDTEAYARSTIAKLETPELKQAIDEILEWQDNVLEYAVDRGLISEETAEKWRASSDFYTPMWRVHQDGLEAIDIQMKTRADERHRTKRVEGGSSDILSPLENLVMNMATITSKADENWIGRMLVDMSAAMPSSEAILSEARPGKEIKFEVSEIKKTLQQVGIDPESMTDEQLQTVGSIFRPMERHQALRQHMLPVVRGGELRYYKIRPGFEDVAEALINTNDMESSTVVRIMAAAAAGLRSGVVLDPAFSARNFIKDTQTRFVQRGDIPIFSQLLDAVAYVSDPALRARFEANYGDMRRYMTKTRESAQQTLAKKTGVDLWSLRQRTQPDPMPSRAWYRSKRGVDAIYQLLEGFVNAGETLNRFGIYRTEEARLLREGLSAEDAATAAAFEARDILNWNRNGSSQFVRNLYSVTAFLKSAVQGMDRSYRVLESDIAKRGGGWKGVSLSAVRGVVGRAVLVGLAKILILKQLKDWLGDEWEHYKERPSYERVNFIYVPFASNKHGEWPRVPLSNDLISGGIPALMELMWRYQSEPDYRRGAYEEDLTAILAQYLGGPIPAPNALALFLEIAFNMNFYTGQQLVPSYLQRLEPRDQAFDSTSETARQASELIHATGVQKLPVIGRELSSKLFTPIAIEHLIRQTTGGLGRLGLTAMDQALGQRDQDPFSGGYDLEPLAARARRLSGVYSRRPSAMASPTFRRMMNRLTELRQMKASAELRDAEIDDQHLEELLLLQEAEKVMRLYSGDIRESVSDRDRDRYRIDALQELKDLEREWEALPAEN